jgi:Fe2+ or Zn2+ uptake regulation protein
MTESEAKKEIEHNVFCNTDNYEMTISKECYKTIINALEKQILKKVKYEDVGYDQYNNVNVYACICPSCGLEIIRFNDNDISDKCESGDTEEMFHSSMVHHAYIGLNNYCNRCGQKLNWESDGK